MIGTERQFYGFSSATQRGRTTAEARAAEELYCVKDGVGHGSIFPAAENPMQAVEYSCYWRARFGLKIPKTLEVWKTDGIIGASLLWDPVDVPTFLGPERQLAPCTEAVRQTMIKCFPDQWENLEGCNFTWHNLDQFYSFTLCGMFVGVELDGYAHS